MNIKSIILKRAREDGTTGEERSGLLPRRVQMPPHVVARPAQCGDPGLPGRAGRPTFPAGRLHVYYLNGYYALGPKARQSFRVELNALFPALLKRAEPPEAPPVRRGGARLSGTGRRREGRARHTDPRGGPATCTRGASGFRLPVRPGASASGTRKPRRCRVGGERGPSTACCNILPPPSKESQPSLGAPATPRDPVVS